MTGQVHASSQVWTAKPAHLYLNIQAIVSHAVNVGNAVGGCHRNVAAIGHQVHLHTCQHSVTDSLSHC